MTRTFRKECAPRALSMCQETIKGEDNQELSPSFLMTTIVTRRKTLEDFSKRDKLSANSRLKHDTCMY